MSITMCPFSLLLLIIAIPIIAVRYKREQSRIENYNPLWSVLCWTIVLVLLLLRTCSN
jgi:cytochrome c oxidase assembly factor CtaG